MPKRPNSVKIDSSSVQGDDSWVEFRRLTWGERKDILNRNDQAEGEEHKLLVVDLMLLLLIDWNWVDKDGNPLPIPKDREELDALYQEESDFLVDLAMKALIGRLTQTDIDLKN